MEIQNKISEQVFDKLRSKFSQITLGDADGNSTTDPSEAVFFNFNYVDKEGHDHGNITVSLIDKVMKVYYSKNITKELNGSELSDWYEFLKDLRKTAMSNLYGFDTHDITKAALDINDIQSTVDRTNNMNETKMYGTSKSSYQECGPAKIIVRHNQRINPDVRGARSRKIESVFVETFEGERFKMPFNSLPGTRAMAQHIAHGGRPYDEIGESITEMVNDISALRPFIARNRSAVFEDETTMDMFEAAKEYYKEARATLNKIKGKRGYKKYTENFEVSEMLEFGDDTANTMKDRFTKKKFSDKMEAAMPVVHKAYSKKRMKPNKPEMNPINEFEAWAEDVTAMPEPIVESCREILDDSEIETIKHWINNQIDELPEDLYEKLFWHYVNNGEMPYGVAKARTGDPDQWLFDRLDQEYGRMESVAEGLVDNPLDSLSDEEEAIVHQWLDHEVDELPWELLEKLLDYYADEIPYGALTGDDDTPDNWLWNKLDAELHGPKFGSKDWSGQVQEDKGEEKCSDACCGPKTISECKCGPECPHCECFFINKLDESVRKGRVAKGKLMPGKRHKNVNEGTWAIPDTPEKLAKLRGILARPLTFGPNGENAAGAIYGLLGDDELHEHIYHWSQRMDPERPANEVIIDWIWQHAPDLAEELRLDELGETAISEDTESTNLIVDRIEKYYPETFRRYGAEYVYDLVDDMSEKENAWELIASTLGIDSKNKIGEELLMAQKATYSDYLDAYKSSDVGGTDSDDDAKRMVKHLDKKGKKGDTKAAKAALKRMAEQEAKSGLHIAEAQKEEMLQLQRDAGIIK